MWTNANCQAKLNNDDSGAADGDRVCTCSSLQEANGDMEYRVEFTKVSQYER